MCRMPPTAGSRGPVPIRLEIGERSIDADQVIACTPGLLGEGPDKLGAVRMFGTGGSRAARTSVQGARMLLREYPEECVFLAPGDPIFVGGERLQQASLVVARGEGRTLVVSRWSPDVTATALGLLERYLTRLVRLDTP